MKRTLLSLALLGALESQAIAKGLEPDTLWTYKQVDGKDLNMSVFLPEDYVSGASFPVIVIFHGGSWRKGEASWHYPDCAYWAGRGMVAVSVDYRLSDRDGVKVPIECVKDAKSAIRYLRANADKLKIDPGRVVAAGGSAGAQLAAATAMFEAPETNDGVYDPSISAVPDAVILYNPWFRTTADMSPPNFVRSGLPPFIIFHGDQDPTPVADILSFHEAMKDAGNDTGLYVGIGGTHGFCNGRRPDNKFFFWSLNLADAFLVRQGILAGSSKVAIPDGVPVLEAGKDFIVH